MDLSIWIRTHSERLYLATRLETTCNRMFGIQADVLNTGAASPHFSYKFALALADRAHRCSTKHILILEDDMELTDTSVDAVREAVSRGDDHNWYSVDTTTNVLGHAVHIPNFGYILSQANHISYSGAILISRGTLREYLVDYMLRVTDLQFPNFDVNLSRYLLATQGHIHLRPGHFAQVADVESSVDPSDAGRVNHARGEIFTYLGPRT